MENQHHHHQQQQQQRLSLRAKKRLSICFSCIFGSICPRQPNQRPSRFSRNSSSLWQQQRSSCRKQPELKERCRSFISRIGNSPRKNTEDFRYDQLSYSLNFDDGLAERLGQAESPFRSFSARLPASPPPPPLQQREVMVACS